MSETSEIVRSSQSFLSTFNRKRRHTFDVELKVVRVLSLPYSNGKFFFKIRLLNGGNHVFVSPLRFEVNENKVEFNQIDHFQVKMTSRVDNFTLDHCFCRISIRKEGRSGRSTEKIGFVDFDLASVAGCGDESKACLLNGYQQTNTNPANAYLELRMKLNVLEGDHIFRRPSTDYPMIQSENNGKHSKKSSDTFTEENFPVKTNEILSTNHLTTTTTTRGHSRQESKSSVCSTNSTTLTTNSNEKSSTNCDERSNGFEHFQRTISKRRNPFIDQFGDIQRRLQSTRVDVQQIVNQVIHDNCQECPNPNGSIKTPIVFSQEYFSVHLFI